MKQKMDYWNDPNTKVATFINNLDADGVIYIQIIMVHFKTHRNFIVESR